MNNHEWEESGLGMDNTDCGIFEFDRSLNGQDIGMARIDRDGRVRTNAECLIYDCNLNARLPNQIRPKNRIQNRLADMYLNTDTVKMGLVG